MQATYVNSEKTGFSDSRLKSVKEGKMKWTGVQYLMYGPKSDTDPKPTIEKSDVNVSFKAEQNDSDSAFSLFASFTALLGSAAVLAF